MPTAKDIKKQTKLKSDKVTPKQAAEMSKGEKLAPHVSDSPADDIERAISKKELMKWSKVVAEAWADYAFKERLMKNPASALKKFGIDVPQGLEFRVVENTDKVRYITLPPKPQGDVTSLSGGAGFAAACCTSCTSFRCRPPKWADTWIIITA
jgi:hypothetical protein